MYIATPPLSSPACSIGRSSFPRLTDVMPISCGSTNLIKSGEDLFSAGKYLPLIDRIEDIKTMRLAA
jgi:hypothetical protein